MARRKALSRKELIERYSSPGQRRTLVRIPSDELAAFNETLPEGIRLISNGNYQARYRAPDKQEVSRNFDTLADAKDWRIKGLSQVAEGVWDNPRSGRETGEHFYKIHLASKATLKASSRDNIADLWNQQVSAWAKHSVGRITYIDVEEWVRDLTAGGYSRSYVRRCAHVLSGILEEAVKRDQLRKNPVVMKSLSKAFPKASQHEPNPLTLDQLDALVEHSSDHYAALTEFIARTGLRISEARELRVKDVLCSGKSPSGADYRKAPVLAVARGAVRVPERDQDGQPVVDEDSGRGVYKEVIDTPKSGARRVPLTPRALGIAKQAMAGKNSDDLLFTNVRGGAVSKHGFGTSLSDAVARSGIETESGQSVTPHSLRDTFATQALLSGASVIAVSKALGHSNPTMTLTRYAGLLPEDTEALRAGLTAAEKAQKQRRKGRSK